MNNNPWKDSGIRVFWGEIAACEHTLQLYENEKVLLDTLEGFAGTGLLAGESVIVIASSAHLKSLEDRLEAQRFDMHKFKTENRFIALDATESLNRFMVNGGPDERLFGAFISETLTRARYKERKVRAFGEMVNMLWEEGMSGATVQLEKMWCKIQEANKFALYCAYPKSGVTQQPSDALNYICAAHSLTIDGKARPTTQIYFRET